MYIHYSCLIVKLFDYNAYSIHRDRIICGYSWEGRTVYICNVR